MSLDSQKSDMRRGRVRLVTGIVGVVGGGREARRLARKAPFFSLHWASHSRERGNGWGRGPLARRGGGWGQRRDALGERGLPGRRRRQRGRLPLFEARLKTQPLRSRSNLLFSLARQQSIGTNYNVLLNYDSTNMS